MAKEHIKKLSVTLIIREMQIKTIKETIHISHTLGLATIKKHKIASFVEDVEKLEPLHTVGGKVKQYSHMENNMAVLSK